MDTVDSQVNDFEWQLDSYCYIIWGNAVYLNLNYIKMNIEKVIDQGLIQYTDQR